MKAFAVAALVSLGVITSSHVLVYFSIPMSQATRPFDSQVVLDTHEGKVRYESYGEGHTAVVFLHGFNEDYV